MYSMWEHVSVVVYVCYRSLRVHTSFLYAFANEATEHIETQTHLPFATAFGSSEWRENKSKSQVVPPCATYKSARVDIGPEP